MSATVSSISKIKIRDKEQNKLVLCNSHKNELGQKVSPDFEHLIASSWFRKNFHEFFPANATDEAKVNITITKKTIIVRKLDGTRARTLPLSTLADKSANKAKGINAEILRKANKVYRRCQSEHPEPNRSPPPSRPVSPSIDLSDSDSDEVTSLRADFSNARRKAQNFKREGLQPQLAEKLARMENKLGDIEKKLGIPVSNVPNDQEKRIEQLFERLGAIEETLPRHPAEEKADLRARLSPQPAALFDEQFAALHSLYTDLCEPAAASQTALPAEQRAAFDTLPESERNTIFYHTYLLADPVGAQTLWRVGEKTFLSEPIEGSLSPEPNSLRAEAIRHYLLHSLAAEFAKAEGNTPPEHLIARFEILSPADQQSILIQLRQGRGTRETSEFIHNAFLGLEGETPPTPSAQMRLSAPSSSPSPTSTTPGTARTLMQCPKISTGRILPATMPLPLPSLS